MSLCVFASLILFRALELQPYSLKALLRRAMAYESLERYRRAYVDYKTVLQIDNGVQAAHDSIHRSGSKRSRMNPGGGCRGYSPSKGLGGVGARVCRSLRRTVSK